MPLPQDIHVLVPRTYAYFPHMAKGIAGVVELRIKMGERLLDHPGGPNAITRVLIREKEEESQRSDVTTSHRMWTASGYWKRQGNRCSCRASRRKAAMPTHVRLLISRLTR